MTFNDAYWLAFCHYDGEQHLLEHWHQHPGSAGSTADFDGVVSLAGGGYHLLRNCHYSKLVCQSPFFVSQGRGCPSGSGYSSVCIQNKSFCGPLEGRVSDRGPQFIFHFWRELMSADWCYHYSVVRIQSQNNWPNVQMFPSQCLLFLQSRYSSKAAAAYGWGTGRLCYRSRNTKKWLTNVELWCPVPSLDKGCISLPRMAYLGYCSQVGSLVHWAITYHYSDRSDHGASLEGLLVKAMWMEIPVFGGSRYCFLLVCSHAVSLVH